MASGVVLLLAIADVKQIAMDAARAVAHKLTGRAAKEAVEKAALEAAEKAWRQGAQRGQREAVEKAAQEAAEKAAREAAEQASRGARLGGAARGARAAPELSTAAKRAIRSTEAELAEHRAKLAAYKKNPFAFDNKGYLARNAGNPEIQKTIIQGRIRHLENEIANFEKRLEGLRSGRIEP
jgi:hypothetical protein